jgi:hypothetical protein
MRIRLVISSTAAFLIASASLAAAQSANAMWGFLALSLTPAGALTPLMPGSGSANGERAAFLAREGRGVLVGPSGYTTTRTSLTVGAAFSAVRSRMTAELGRMSISNCDHCSAIIGGVDATIPIGARGDPAVERATRLAVALNPALGFCKPIRAEGADWAATFALNLPVSIEIPIGNRARVVPFISPGFGLGRLNGRYDSQSGSRGMIGGGVGLADVIPGIEISGSFRKIIISGPYAPRETLYGVGLTWHRG